MRILVLGAGGVGGYFGGRLIEAGGDVTFLVRERRAAQLARDGLVIESPHGNVTLPAKTTSVARDEGWDLVWLTCKAYDLDVAIATIAPAMGRASAVLPLLNGVRHLDALDAQLGAGRVLPGVAYVGATLTAEGVVRQLGVTQRLGFGARDGAPWPVLVALAEAFAKVKIEARLLADPLQGLWEKWVMLGALAAMSSLMRANVGRIVATDDGAAAMRACLAEVVAIAVAEGRPPGEGARSGAEKMLTEPGSGFASSLMRDMQNGGRTEADHIVGDLVRRARRLAIATPWLAAAWIHLQAYEAGRAV
jgi:2-dehydropantoate 2-reductase